MANKLLKSGGVSANALHVDVEAGKYAGFLINFYGTVNSGQTVANTDLGKVRLLRDGDQLMQIDIDRLQDWNDLDLGQKPETNNFNFTCVLPCRVDMGRGGDKNAIFCDVDGQVKLELDSFYNSTKMATGTVTVQGITAPGGEKNYHLKVYQHDFSAGVGTTPQTFHNTPNLIRVLLGYSANISNAQLLVDGRQVVQSSGIILNDYTCLMNRIETHSTTTPLYDLMVAESMNEVEVRNNSSKLEVTVITSAITAETTVISLDILG